MLSIEHGVDYEDVEEANLPYTHVRNLGHGQSGNVEEVKDQLTGQVYARKTIRIVGPSREKAERMRVFRNEIGIIRGLESHRHIISVHATYATKRYFGILLQPVASEGDLEEFLTEFKERTHEADIHQLLSARAAGVITILSAFGCLASGLAFMHGRRIRHKDIKPRNILVHEGRMLYTDFGYSFDSNGFTRTTTEGLHGFLTRRYSAPEVIKCEPRNSKSDVFSLGCVFLEMLSALTQWLICNEEQLYSDILESVHQQLRTINVPSQLAILPDLITSMMLQDQRNRPMARQICDLTTCHVSFSCVECRLETPPNTESYRSEASALRADHSYEQSPVYNPSSDFHTTTHPHQPFPHGRNALVSRNLNAQIGSTPASHHYPEFNQSYNVRDRKFFQTQHSEDTQEDLSLEENQDYLVEDDKRLPLKYVNFLGKGNNSFVVKVLDTKTGAVFAKKFIRYPGAKARVKHEDCFNNEVSITRSLKGQRHIVQLFATYITKREFGLILQPAADGGNLANYLFHYEEVMDHQARGSDFATMTVALERAFGCLANALAFIHTQEICHGEIKPENILMHGNYVVITDFGASRNARLPGMAVTEGVVDFQTRRYSAPEVLKNEKQSFEADVYSMGCVFLEVYCKLTPMMQYDGNSCFSHIMDSLHDTIHATPVSERVDFLKKIIVSMTLQERKQRPSIDKIYQVIAQEDGFCCEDCRNESKRISAYSCTKWEWSFKQQLYHCYLLNEAGVKIGEKWYGNPPTIIMYPVGGPSDELRHSSISDLSFHESEAAESSRYRRVKAASRADFFQPGRVFKMLWSEPASDTNRSRNSSYDSVEQNTAGDYNEIRRFVVVRNKGLYSQCIRIQPYRRRRSASRGADKRIIPGSVSVIHTSLIAPEPSEEENITKNPIRVIPEKGQDLRPESRLNFSKQNFVEHKVKVVNIGMIVPESLYLVTHYFEEAIGG
ncbi:kinase-like domain-containing protein [Paraphoma chrysanthemicola]|uniref:Kinase-like domain-containing protein n=1 Tax=Paraphoma chrysanthemicola TaxID=798071 RepID=A0A8K0W200_9PLEO|nr:kinase-like domain-containing protein [Paraphoma chrysanthemicola]